MPPIGILANVKHVLNINKLAPQHFLFFFRTTGLIKMEFGLMEKMEKMLLNEITSDHLSFSLVPFRISETVDPMTVGVSLFSKAF